MQNNKIKTYIGFAIKSRKLRTGVNVIKSLNKGVYLLLLCKSASENTVSEAKSLAKKFGCKILVTAEDLLEDVVYKVNCKLAGVTEPNLAKAIYDNYIGDFTVIQEA